MTAQELIGERAEFEAFASQHGLCVTEDGDLYRSHVVAWMWKAWQARAALSAQPAASAEPVLRIYAEGGMRSVTEWLDGARDLPDGDHTLYATPVAAQAEQPDPNVRYGDGFHDGYWKGREEGWDAAMQHTSDGGAA